MDEKGSDGKNSSDSSLSDSWNIVDGSDVHNVSEGSDGESIEVIEEEGNNNSDGKKTNKEKVESGEETTSKSDDETLVTTSQLLIDESSIKENDVIPNSSEAEVSQNFNAVNILGLVALICAIIFGAATSWAVLLRVEEIALDTFHYFIPERLQESSSNSRELNELLKQIKLYETETKNLKSLVTDLNVAVENLKKELAFPFKFAEKSGLLSTHKKENNQTADEDILFREILNIHLGKFNIAGEFQNEVNSSYDQIGKFVQQMVFNLTSGQERENNMETIKLFYQIPKQLAVLKNFNSTNKNIELFVNAWRARLIFVNEKIVENIKNMQLKMVRKLIKQIKCTQKKFYTKLCNLNGLKKQECYDTFVKPYEHSEEISPSVPEEKFDPNIQLSGSEESDVIKILKDTVDNTTNKQRMIELPTRKESSHHVLEKQEENKGKLEKTIENNKSSNEMLSQKTTKNIKEEEQSFKDEKKNIDKRKINKPGKIKKENNNLYESTINEKGMDNNLNTDPPNNDAINSFSSFSKVQGEETGHLEKTDFKSGKDGPWEKKEGGLQEKKEKLGGFPESDSEGCWFLKIGSQRSKLRKSEARSNWLFERARYRGTRNT